jgi:hypothetical protein
MMPIPYQHRGKPKIKIKIWKKLQCFHFMGSVKPQGGNIPKEGVLAKEVAKSRPTFWDCSEHGLYPWWSMNLNMCRSGIEDRDCS